MHIAMLSVHTCPLATLGGKETGGMNVYVRELARELGRKGVRVDVYTRSQDEHQPHIKHDLGYGNRVFHIPAGPELPLPKTELYQYLGEFVGGVRLAAALLEEHYDLIHSHYWLSAIVARELQHFWGAPIVHMAHTLGVMKNRVAQSDDEREPPLRLQSEEQALAWADRVIASTQAEVAQIRWLLQVDTDNVAVIPPGVDLQLFHPSSKRTARNAIEVEGDDTLILFVGRIEPLKGADTLLYAMQELRASGDMPSKLCVALIGGDPSQPRETRFAEMQKLMELRDELGLGEVVTFLGKRAQETLHNYYVAADVVVMPSVYESFGMVALEAMACGTPVIASEVGGLAFLVDDGETGFLIPDRDPRALADRLRRVLGDPALRVRLGSRGAEVAREYSWDVIADRMIEVYQDVLTKSGQRKQFDGVGSNQLAQTSVD